MVPSLSRSVSSLLVVLSSVRAAIYQDPRESRSALIPGSVVFRSLFTSRNVLQSYRSHRRDGHTPDATRK